MSQKNSKEVESAKIYVVGRSAKIEKILAELQNFYRDHKVLTACLIYGVSLDDLSLQEEIERPEYVYAVK